MIEQSQAGGKNERIVIVLPEAIIHKQMGLAGNTSREQPSCVSPEPRQEMGISGAQVATRWRASYRVNKLFWTLAFGAALAHANAQGICGGPSPSIWTPSTAPLNTQRSATGNETRGPESTLVDEHSRAPVPAGNREEKVVDGADGGTALPDAPSETAHNPDNTAPASLGAAFPSGTPRIFQIQPRPVMAPQKTIDRLFITLETFQLAAMVADVESTVRGLSRGGREGNPLVGEHPSRPVLYGIGLSVDAGITYWSYHLKKYAPHSKRWRIIPLMLTGIHGGIAIRNMAVTSGRSQ